MPLVQPPSFDALGIISFQINPHYVDADSLSTRMGETRRQRLLEFVEETGRPVVALREGAMLHFETVGVKVKGSSSALIFRGSGEPIEATPGAHLNL